MYKKLTTIRSKINEQLSQSSPIEKTYSISDDSVQSELRFRAEWTIRLAVDHIHYPKNLRRDSNNLWTDMHQLSYDISRAADITTGRDSLAEKINIKTKTGPARRISATEQFEIAAGNQFLADCKLAKKHIKKLNKQITELQSRQKILLPQLRRANSDYLAEKRAEKTKTARKNTEALASGEFWLADRDALKDYFNPPFEKNYLADVSEKWRAALFLDCKSISYKTVYGNWGHKLGATGMGYLCGIDDNGDEWGHEVDLSRYQGYDDFCDMRLEGEVEWAMAELFRVPVRNISTCFRQGDLLFCPVAIPAKIEMYAQEKWNVRESHKVWSPGLYRNGHYVSSCRDIVVSHTSHEPVYLPAGSYELHTLQVVDAD